MQKSVVEFDHRGDRIDPLGGLTLNIALRTNRRGFVGIIGKGALAATAAFSGVLAGVGGPPLAALACSYCWGCTANCMPPTQASSCNYQRTDLSSGITYWETCWWNCVSCGDGTQNRYAQAPSGSYAVCPCNCLTPCTL